MHVILLNGGGKAWSSTFFRSIGPYKIAHWVRKHGYSCQVIDHTTRFTEEQIYLAIKKFVTSETRVIGLSTTFVSRHPVKHSDGKFRTLPEPIYRAMHSVRREHPGIKFVVGGYISDRIGGGWEGLLDATVMSYRTATEDVFLEYLEHLILGKDEPIGEMRSPNFGGSPRMIYSAARSPKYRIENDDFRFTKQDVILPGEALPLDVSRGCIFSCKFCQFPHTGKKKMDYLRGMDRIRDEIIHNKENFGTTRYFMLDDTFNDTEFKMREFHLMTQTLGFDIDYAAYLRADLIHRFPDTAYMLKESGLFGAFHGIETLHPDAGKMIGKGWSGTHAREYVPRLYHDIWDKKIAQHLAFIVGFPDETPDHARETARWFEENELHSVVFNRLDLYGKSKYHNWEHISEFDRNAEKYGFEWLDEDKDGVGWRKWKNKNWTNETADAVATELNLRIEDLIKTPMWMSVSLLWYGYDRQRLIDTRLSRLPMDLILSKTEDNFARYYEMLMDL